MTYQSILFKKKYFTLEEAEHYIKRFGYEPIKKVHETANMYRFRLAEPIPDVRYRIVKLPKKGVEMVIMLN